MTKINNEPNTCTANPAEVSELAVESLEDVAEITKKFIQLDTCELEYLHIKLLNNKGVKDDKERK